MMLLARTQNAHDSVTYCLFKLTPGQMIAASALPVYQKAWSTFEVLLLLLLCEYLAALDWMPIAQPKSEG